MITPAAASSSPVKIASGRAPDASILRTAAAAIGPSNSPTPIKAGSGDRPCFLEGGAKALLAPVGVFVERRTGQKGNFPAAVNFDEVINQFLQSLFCSRTRSLERGLIQEQSGAAGPAGNPANEGE